MGDKRYYIFCVLLHFYVVLIHFLYTININGEALYLVVYIFYLFLLKFFGITAYPIYEGGK